VKNDMGPARRSALAAAALACALLAAPAPRAAEPAARPKYGAQAVRLQDDRSHVREREAPDFWALLPYYLPQPTDSACSSASVAMLLNALRAGQALGADEPLVTHDGLLERAGDAEWTRAVRPGGEGSSLDQLGRRIERSLGAYGLAGYRVEVVHTPDASAAALARLREALTANEVSRTDFVLANFLQSELTGDPEGAVGHIAPIAAYDAVRRRVLMLDPDRTWYEPYWVSDEVLLRGMSTRDADGGGQARGFVWIRPTP
jgi:hypothetical protein